jgi:hypothetical protein
VKLASLSEPRKFDTMPTNRLICGAGTTPSPSYRDAEVVVTSWTDARISWPRCRAIGVRGGSGLLITKELVQALRTESSLASQYWWGVRAETVWRWRKAFGVTPWGTEGSRRLHQSLSEKGGANVRGKKLPRALIKRRLKIRAEHG